MNLWRKPDINLWHHFIWLLNLLHQVSHSNSKTTVNADRKESSGNRDNADLRGNEGSRIVIEAIDKKLALLFVKQGGSSVSAALLNGVAFFLRFKGRVAAVVQQGDSLVGIILKSPHSAPFLAIDSGNLSTLIYPEQGVLHKSFLPDLLIWAKRSIAIIFCGEIALFEKKGIGSVALLCLVEISVWA